MWIGAPIAAICVAAAFAGPASVHAGQAETVAPKFDQAIPNIPGKSLIAVEVDYAPGAASPSHTHAKSAFIFAYVLSGEIESKVNDGEARIYKAGESWSEAPGAPSGQPQPEQGQAGQAARGVRRGFRRHAAHHPGEVRRDR